MKIASSGEENVSPLLDRGGKILVAICHLMFVSYTDFLAENWEKSLGTLCALQNINFNESLSSDLEAGNILQSFETENFLIA